MKYKRLPASDNVEDRRGGDGMRQRAIREDRLNAVDQQGWGAEGERFDPGPRYGGWQGPDPEPSARVPDKLRDAMGRQEQENDIALNEFIRRREAQNGRMNEIVPKLPNADYARGGRVGAPRKAKTRLREM